MFVPCSDLAAAKWIAASDGHWWNLVTLGPPGFPAYARLRFIPDPAHEGQPESAAARQADAPSDNDQLRIAAGTLLQRTAASDEGYVLIWDGWGGDSFPRGVAGRDTPPYASPCVHLARAPGLVHQLGCRSPLGGHRSCARADRSAADRAASRRRAGRTE